MEGEGEGKSVVAFPAAARAFVKAPFFFLRAAVSASFCRSRSCPATAMRAGWPVCVRYAWLEAEQAGRGMGERSS